MDSILENTSLLPLLRKYIRHAAASINDGCVEEEEEFWRLPDVQFLADVEKEIPILPADANDYRKSVLVMAARCWGNHGEFKMGSMPHRLLLALVKYDQPEIRYV